MEVVPLKNAKSGRVKVRAAVSQRKSGSPGSFLKRFLRWEILIVVAAVICDINSWGHRFVLDDGPYIAENSFIQNPANFFRLFTSHLVPIPLAFGRMYRPLTALTLGINCWIGGLNPDLFHLINRFIHILVCLGIFWVLRRLLADPVAAGLTALIYAVHPIQTEAITYITGRSDSQAMLFFIFGWYCHICARQREESKKPWYAAAFVLYLFSMMSKESGITWAGVILLTEFVYFSQSSLRGFKQSLQDGLWKVLSFYLIAPLLFLGARAWVRDHSLRMGGQVSIVDNPLAHIPFPARVVTGIKVLFENVGLVVWPVSLSSDYSYNQIEIINRWSSPAGLAFCAAILGLIVLIAWSRRRARHIFFGLGFFLITYSLVSNLVVVIGTIRADRLLYMPALGIVFIAGTLISSALQSIRRPQTRNAAYAAIAIVILLLSARTILRNKIWKDEMTLALTTVQTAPKSFRAHRNLGVAYASESRFDEALKQYRIAESIYSEEPLLLSSIGLALSKTDKTEEAVRYYQRSVAMAPRNPMIRFRLSTALRSVGDYAGAKAQDEAIIAFYDDLIRQDPDSADHHYYKANALVAQQELELALEEYKRTLRLDPKYAHAQETIDKIQKELSRR